MPIAAVLAVCAAVGVASALDVGCGGSDALFATGSAAGVGTVAVTAAAASASGFESSLAGFFSGN
ncbi:MAG: hypothetical protein HC782_00535 [Gammaproteobacteria bacterium]|nr:hypothetical protein [Gammaproteobacteria bacterium]